MIRCSHSTVAALLVLVLAGCSGPTRDEVSERELDKIRGAVIATSAKARAVVFTDYSFAAEPPPDAASSVTSELLASLSGQYGDEDSPSARIDAGVATKIAESLSILGKRTQGLSYLRDSGFRLAEARANSIQASQQGSTATLLSDAEWKSLFEVVLDNSRDLIMFELNGNPLLLNAPAAGELDPDLFKTTASVLVANNRAALTLSLLDPSRAGMVVPISVRSLLPQHAGITPVSSSATLDAAGYAAYSVNIDDAWTIVELTAPGSRGHTVMVVRR